MVYYNVTMGTCLLLSAVYLHASSLGAAGQCPGPSTAECRLRLDLGLINGSSASCLVQCIPRYRDGEPVSAAVFF